jgi:hypothetical protein
VFPQWIRQGLGGYATRAAFLDIGTPESFAHAGEFMEEARASRSDAELLVADAIGRDGMPHHPVPLE